MRKSGFFWVGYADLMTSLFFVVLILYVVSFALYKKQLSDIHKFISELEDTNNQLESANSQLEKTKKLLLVQAEKAKIIEAVEQNLEPLKKEKDLFVYDNKYKRFNLAFDVQFKYGRSKINSKDLVSTNTIDELITVGTSLENLIEKLRSQKETDNKFKEISYLIVVSGSASDFGEDEFKNYLKSYERAYYLYKFWKENGVDLDAKKYHDLVDFQIAGNGIGGVGRFSDEEKNQRFIINIIPKIGEIQ